VKLFPAYHGYAPDCTECSDAVDAAAEMGLPVMLSFGFEDPRVHQWTLQIPGIDVQAVARLASTKRGKRLVLSAIHTGEARGVLSAAEGSDYCVEISHMEGPIMCVQQLVKDMGADRVLLGTQAPFMNPKGAMLALGEPGFEAGDLARVLGENANALLRL